MTPARITGLSDGVIAIAITILAINLIPALHEHEGNLWAIQAELTQYIIGFLSLGIYWMLHHHIIHIIKRSDGVLVWLNLGFLALASLGPFWTALITKNPSNAEATGFLGLSSCLTFMMLQIILVYAAHSNRLVSPDLDERVPWGLSNIILIGLLIMVIGTIWGIFNPDIFGLFSLASLIWFLYMTGIGYEKYFSYQKPINKRRIENKVVDETEQEQGLFYISPDRTMLLTDGVIAIAITLMVLELEIPDLKENPNGLLEMTGDLFLIAVGFLSLGLYWTFHHYLFHYIKRADGVLMLLNIMFLALASLVPFWVAFININVGENEAMIYYGVGMILTLLVLMYIWFYATRNHRLVSKDLEKNIITGWLKVLMVALIVSVIVIAGNVLIPWFKFISWIFSLVFFIYLTAHGYKNFLVPENLEPKNKTKAII